MDLININDLEVDCIIGINPSERTKSQQLYISAELGLDLSCCARTNNLNDTVNYAEVCEELKDLAVKLKAELLEVLADKMCELIFCRHKRVRSVKLSLLKPEAVADAQSVGISIERTRSYYIDGRTAYDDIPGSPQSCAVEPDLDVLKFSLYRTCYKNFRRPWREDLSGNGRFRRSVGK